MVLFRLLARSESSADEAGSGTGSGSELPASRRHDEFSSLVRRSVGDRNGNFRDGLVHSAKLRRKLGAEFEMAAFKFYLRQQRSAKHFVTSGLVVNVGAVEKICDMGQQLRT